MKRIFIAAALIALTLPITIFAKPSATPPGQAREASPAASASNGNQDLTRGAKNWKDKLKEYQEAAQEKRLEQLKSLGQTLIENRLQLLERLKSRLQASENIPDATIQTLVADIDKTITDLQNLATEISNATDLEPLKDLVKSIFQNFQVYSVVAPRDLGQSLTAQGMYILGRLEAIQRQLQQMLEQKKNQGKDITSLQSLIDQVTAKLNDAKAQLAIADEKFKSMTPANSDTAKTSREEGKAAMKAAKQDLKDAHDLLKQIFNALKVMSASPSPGASVSPTSSPTASVGPTVSPTVSPSPTISPSP